MDKSKKLLPDPAGFYGLVVFWILLLFSGKRALGDGDPFWHIRAGATMLEQGRILTHDVFSHTAAGKEWIAHEWLSEVIMAFIHQVAGLPGVVIFFFFLVSLTFWFLFRTISRLGGDWLAFFILSLTLAISTSHLLARPHLFSWFFGVLTLAILIRGGWFLLLLPPLTALWTNLHGGFLLGLTLQGIYLLGPLLDHVEASGMTNLRSFYLANRLRILVFLLSILAVGLNPFGYRLLFFPFQVTETIFSTPIGEWLSPDLQGLWHFRLYLLFIIILLFFTARHLSWTSRCLLLVFLNAALTHARHFSIAALFLTPFFLEALGPWTERIRKRIRRRFPARGTELALSPISGPLAMTLICSLLLFLGWTKNPWWGELADELVPMPESYSQAGIDFIGGKKFSGHLFNDYTWGGYLLYGLNSPPSVFIDGRADMYGKEIFEDYLKITRLEVDPIEKFAEYGVTWVVYPPGKGLTRFLLLHPDWNEIYRDEQISVFSSERQDQP